MKHFKNTHCLLLLLFAVKATTGLAQAISAPVLGLHAILPDVQSGLFTASGGNISGGYDYQWSTNCSSDVTIDAPTSIATKLTIPKTSSCGVFELYFDYKDSGGTQQPTIDYSVAVLPYLVASSSVIYPGETVTVNATNVGNFSSVASSPSYLWITTPNGYYSGGQGTSTQYITCPSSGFSSNILVDVGFSCADNHISGALTTLTLPVKLRNPSINGASSIGCGGSSSSSSNYSATSVTGAAYYVWTYPTSLFTAVGTTTGQVITLDAFDLGSGNITVQAFSAQGSSISSAVISMSVQVCCLGTRTFSVLVNSGNSPYNKEAATQINSTNTITATGSATLHADDEVRLMPGFEAQAGCELHVYNDGCSGSYYRLASFDNENDTNSTEEITYQNENSVSATNKTLGNPTDVHDRFSIAPNPTTGEITINVFDKSSPLLSVSVYNAMGIKVYEVQTTDVWHHVINLANLINGMYSARLTFTDYTASKLLIKQSD